MNKKIGLFFCFFVVSAIHLFFPPSTQSDRSLRHSSLLSSVDLKREMLTATTRSFCASMPKEEIADAAIKLCVNEDIGGFDVPMNKLAVVCFVDDIANPRVAPMMILNRDSQSIGML